MYNTTTSGTTHLLALIEAIEYTPLGVRAITAMNQVRIAIANRKQEGS